MISFQLFIKKKEPCGINVLFEKLFEVRQQAHLLHLNSHSYAEHVALGQYYEELTELTDKLVEVYQGEHELVDLSPGEKIKGDAKSLLEGFGSFLKGQKTGESHLDNIIDEVTALTFRTLYKLRFLK